MNIATRDLLSELLVAALEHPVEAAALRCLATYCGTVKKALPAMAVERFVAPVSEAERAAALAFLQQYPLLSWDLRGRSGRVTLAPAFAAEYPEIVPKLIQYGTVLEELKPDRTASAITTALRKGVLLFNHHLFFEVHEVLEAQWMKESGDERQFLQGLIQIAVAFYHLGNHNRRGALSLLHDGLEKIVPYQPVFLGVELSEFIADLEECLSEIPRLKLEEFSQFCEEKIPRMRFVG